MAQVACALCSLEQVVSRDTLHLQPDAPDPECNCYIGGLPPHWNEEAVRANCIPFGEIKSIRIMRDKDTQMSKCYGFVTFARRDSAQRAMQKLNQLAVEGAFLQMRLANVKGPDGATTVNPNMQRSRAAPWQQQGYQQPHEEEEEEEEEYGRTMSLDDCIKLVTDGKVWQEWDVRGERAKILQGLADDGFAPHEISRWEFDRLPALLTFSAAACDARPPLHVFSFHLSTGTIGGRRTKQQRAEVHVLQRLMQLAWRHGVQLVAMGDHNADMADAAAVWDSEAVEGFAECCQRLLPKHFCTNRHCPHPNNTAAFVY